MARQRTVTKNRYIFFIISQGRKIRILNAYTGDPNTKDEPEGLRGWVRSLNSPPPTVGWHILTHNTCSGVCVLHLSTICSADLRTGATVRANPELQLALLVRPTGCGMVKLKMMMMIKLSICQTSSGQHEHVSVCFDMYTCLVYAVWLFCSCCFLSPQTPEKKLKLRTWSNTALTKLENPERAGIWSSSNWSIRSLASKSQCKPWSRQPVGPEWTWFWVWQLLNARPCWTSQKGDYWPEVHPGPWVTAEVPFNGTFT